jgi:hypothetical protein
VGGMNQSGKIGIMTFHAAHNYGSVLQAYATQHIISDLGYKNEIINYRLPNQKSFYNDLYSCKFGAKAFLRRIMRFSEHGKRILRKERFENFICGKMRLSDVEYNTYEELLTLHNAYRVLLSGSDQVWNEHCKAEFMTEPPESILGYYLAFANSDTPKISFSSSFGGMKENEIKKYIPLLEQYSFLSVREADGAKILSNLLNGQSVENTLDPTLLLNKESWNQLCNEGKKENYILVYTLRQYHATKELLEHVKVLADRFRLTIKLIAPFSIVRDSKIESVIESGPEEFITYIRDASLVITDSFHGTAFSVNMGTPFYVIEHSKDNRKSLLLKTIGLQNRIISTFQELEMIQDYSCDYSQVYKQLENERRKSVRYLKMALEEAYAIG